MRTGSSHRGQRFLWVDHPAPPYLRYQRLNARQALLWVVADAAMDMSRLAAAFDGVQHGEAVVPAFLRFAGYDLSGIERGLLDRYRLGDVGQSFWVQVDAAGARYVPPPEPRANGGRPLSRDIPFSTAGPLVAVTKALTRTSRSDWISGANGVEPVSRHTFADFEIRLNPVAAARAGAPGFGAGVCAGDDPLVLLREYGGQKASMTVRVCVHLAARRAGEQVSFDEILQELGYKRPAGRIDGREHRRAAKLDAYGRILLGQSAIAVGELKRTVHGRAAGYQAWSLYAVDHVTFDETGVPATIALLPAGLSRLIAEDPAYLEYLGTVHDVLALPDTTAGRWAAAVLYAIRLHWRLNLRYARLHANSGRERVALEFPPLERRQLFAVMCPDPPAPDDILESHDPRRAITSFDEAMKLLQDRGTRGGGGPSACHVSYWRGLPTARAKTGREPWELATPGARPRVEAWRGAWLGQRLDVRPGGADLAELLELRERVRVAQRGLARGRSHRLRVAGR